jgi:hypothetical protein
MHCRESERHEPVIRHGETMEPNKAWRVFTRAILNLFLRSHLNVDRWDWDPISLQDIELKRKKKKRKCAIL